MTGKIRGNAVIAQGGGPTAVINQSLVGVVEGLRDASEIPKILGARHGVRGMVDRTFIELQSVPQATLERIANTPSAGLGSTRDKPDAAYCQRILESLRAEDVRYLFYIGGNDSSDTCRIIGKMAAESGYDLRAFHVPKTVDNDLMESDHTPGFPSAARYVAIAFMGDNLDNASIPGIKINIVMGRHAGFLVGAAAAGRVREDDGPHLVYVPERAFDVERFVEDVRAIYTRHGRCQIAVSEGICDADHNPIASTLFQGETDAHGNVQLSGTGALGDMLAELLKKRLTPPGGKPPRVRADTLGYAQRYWPYASPVDQREARAAGHLAATIARAGDASGSIAIQRASSTPYEPRLVRIPLEAVAAKTRHMPDEFINAEGNNVTPAFVQWLRPLLGDLPVIERL